MVVPASVPHRLPFEHAQEWRDAIYAKIVQKVGDREYWENWSATIAEVAARHTERITALVTDNPSPEVAEQFDTFVTALRANLNDGISATDAISMLSQHLITKPVFDALFEGYETLGERGLGDFELGGCGSEVLIFRNGDESAQLSKCRAILFIMHAYHSNTYL